MTCAGAAKRKGLGGTIAVVPGMSMDVWKVFILPTKSREGWLLRLEAASLGMPSRPAVSCPFPAPGMSPTSCPLR